MDILLRLKAETREVHEELEESLNLLRADFSKNDYLELLKKFYGFYRALEEKLPDGPYSGREKLPALRRDLKNLGLTEETITALPVATLPLHQGPEEFWGRLYVVEGSTLGSQVLTRHFGAKFGFTPDQGLAFFFGEGEKTVPRWREFQQMLRDAVACDHLNEDLIIKSAREAFRFLKTWLISSRPETHG